MKKATEAQVAGKGYPSLFLSGFLGYGEGTLADKYYHYWGFSFRRDLLKHLRKEGYEVYDPGLGPFNSAWDRSCILWAYLMGGTVDFGKVHSEKYGHARYGRTYPGVLKDWGEKGPHEKVNIIGHSFGGPAIKMFAELICNGSDEEIAGTPADELSPLFKKDKPQKIHTITSLSGVMNGTTLADLFGERGMKAATWIVLMLAAMIGDTSVTNLYDLYFDHWDGLTSPPDRLAHKFHGPLYKKDAIRAYAANHIDSVFMEMQTATARELNEKYQHLDPDTYYFCRRANRTVETKHGFHRMARGASQPTLNVTLYFLGHYKPKTIRVFGNDKNWYPNDSLVNTPGMSAPFNAPQQDITDAKDAKPGMWNNLPVEPLKDHMSWIGTGEKRDDFYAYFDRMLEDFQALK
ncbi:MAG: hypothetical protein IIZ60_02855 [Clostridia bacterium]|nr:hypothetical protein [Clostridia bacterium]